MNEAQPWWVPQRGEAIAIVQLTRHPSVSVARLNQWEGSELDLVCKIQGDGLPEGRYFVVVVSARDERLSSPVAEQWMASLAGRRRVDPTGPVPTGPLLIDVREKTAYFSWLVQSVAASDGNPRPPARYIIPQQLDTETLEEIVQQVNSWYDALATTLAA